MMKKKCILVIDPSPSHQWALEKLLAEAFDVKYMTDGSDVLVQLKETSADMFIVSAMLPQMDSYALCRLLKSDEVLCRRPVLFILDPSHHHEKTKVFENGGDDYILLPFHDADVLAKIYRHLKMRDRMELVEESSFGDCATAYKRAQKIAQIGHFTYSPLTNRLEGSDELTEILGLKKGPFDLSDLLNCVCPEVEINYSDIISLKKKEKSSYNKEHRIVMSDGTFKWIRLILEFAIEESRNQGVLIGTVQDITDQKKIEETLQNSQLRLELATKAGNIGVWDWDIKRDLLIWDESMYRLYGIQMGDFEAVYKAWINTVHPNDRKRADGEIQAALRGEREYEPEFRIINPDGSIRHIKANSHTYRDEAGNPIRMVGTNIDITELKTAELELIHYRDHLEETIADRTLELEVAMREAKAANHAKSAFLSNMSHEIRTPMNSVLGFAQLLERDPSLTPEARTKVSAILKSGDHLLSVINDILEMSRIEAGHVELRIEPVDLPGLMEDIALMFRLRAEEKGLAFTLNQSASLPQYVKTDLGKLRQIVINLLGNAIKFTNQGAVYLQIEAKANDTVCIKVMDTGMGMSELEIPKLFQPFERTIRGEDIGGGTGLGLAISRSYAHLMGGEITVDSRLGEGSSFTFEFCAPTAVVPSRPGVGEGRAVKLSERQGNIHLLIVDDQRSIRTMLKQMLEPLGFTVDTVESGEAALELLKTKPTQVVLLDMVMPGLSGIETAQIIRRSYSRESIVIIGISASAFEEERKLYIDSGINAFVAKPFKEKEITDALALHAGLEFIVEDTSEDGFERHNTVMMPTLNNMPRAWCEQFAEALAQGSISRIRILGEEARPIDPELAAYVLQRIDLYDLNQLKKL